MGQAPAWKEGEEYQAISERPLSRGLRVRPARGAEELEALAGLAIRSRLLLDPEAPALKLREEARTRLEEARSRGALLVAEDARDGRLAGYLLGESGGGYEVVEAPGFRARGVATLLVDTWEQEGPCGSGEEASAPPS